MVNAVFRFGDFRLDTINPVTVYTDRAAFLGMQRTRRRLGAHELC